MAGGIATGVRVRYSAEGVRVLCTKPVYGFQPDNPERVGSVLRRVTKNVAEVLWDDRRSPQLLHVDFLSPDSASTTSQAETHGPDADNSAVVASAPAAFYSVARPLPLAAPEAATDAAGASPGASRTNSGARPS